MEILKTIDETARAQFRLDTNCPKEIEDEYRIMINPSANLPGSRRPYGMTSDFRAIIYKGDLYMMAGKSLYEWAKSKYSLFSPEWFCKFPNLRELDNELQKSGHELFDTHIYFLPDPDFDEPEMDCPYDFKWYDEWDIAIRFSNQNPFPHAFCFDKNLPDILGIVAYDGLCPIAAAGASFDGKYMRQIGIDVKEEYRHHGLAVFLVTMLKNKILEMGLLPFYGTSESHILSQDTAIRCGFLPAWCEIYAQSKYKARSIFTANNNIPAAFTVNRSKLFI
ncbi:MAG: GNAT family N-acetyltransferase [Lachnospiraceae bacterium]|nr:GNAT family N-acetyltransferase [Lachnospiraceae bacterium]